MTTLTHITLCDAPGGLMKTQELTRDMKAQADLRFTGSENVAPRFRADEMIELCNMYTDITTISNVFFQIRLFIPHHHQSSSSSQHSVYINIHAPTHGSSFPSSLALGEKSEIGAHAYIDTLTFSHSPTPLRGTGGAGEWCTGALKSIEGVGSEKHIHR